MSEPIENPVVQEPTPGTGGEKTFTQAEVDALIGKRVAKAMKGMPNEEELAAFRTWKESQQTEQERWNALSTERDNVKTSLAAAQAKIEQYEREKLLTAKGVPADDLDYYVFKIGKLVTDSKSFEDAADEFIRQNKPREAQSNGVSVDMTAPLTGGNRMTKAEILAIKDTEKRQRAIAENHELFGY